MKRKGLSCVPHRIFQPPMKRAFKVTASQPWKPKQALALPHMSKNEKRANGSKP